MPRAKKQSTVRRDLVSQEILEQAAALFAERGFSSTTLQDVAQALGISRTALYHYIGGKEELLEALVRGLPAETADSLGRIADDKTLEPLDQLSAALTDMALRIATKPARFRLLLMSESNLPQPLASEYTDSRRRALTHLTVIIKAGMDAGELRHMDERIAAFGLIGMCNWVAWWYRPDRPDGATPDQIAGDLASLGVMSLRGNTDRAPAGQAGTAHAIDLLRQDLQYLERSLDES